MLIPVVRRLRSLRRTLLALRTRAFRAHSRRARTLPSIATHGLSLSVLHCLSMVPASVVALLRPAITHWRSNFYFLLTRRLLFVISVVTDAKGRGWQPAFLDATRASLYSEDPAAIYIAADKDLFA